MIGPKKLLFESLISRIHVQLLSEILKIDIIK